MLMEKVWDHAVGMQERFVPRKEKIYLLSRKERGGMHEFIEEQLRKGYIKPSKSPQTVSVFFVGKKNNKKRVVQDYQYLNKWTIKKNYPLPLILDIIDNIDAKKIFTKLDL